MSRHTGTIHWRHQIICSCVMKVRLAKLKQKFLHFRVYRFVNLNIWAVGVLRYFSDWSLNHLLSSTQPELLKPLPVGRPSEHFAQHLHFQKHSSDRRNHPSGLTLNAIQDTVYLCSFQILKDRIIPLSNRIAVCSLWSMNWFLVTSRHNTLQCKLVSVEIFAKFSTLEWFDLR
jgi:hypothetical protein